MNKFRLLLGGMLLFSTTTMFGQGAKNIRINEVLTNNTASIQDVNKEPTAYDNMCDLVFNEDVINVFKNCK